MGTPESTGHRQHHIAPIEKFRFLVVGAGRGGTSLLAALLDTHTELEVGFERHSQDTLMGRAMFGPDRDDLHSRTEAFVSACNADALGASCRFWGNKITTEQIYGLEDHNRVKPRAKLNVLDVFFNHYFGKRKIVFILRDGRACVRSKVRRAGRSFDLACERWRYSVACYRFIRENHAENLCIRFEDLLYAPETTLKTVCDFLGVSYQHAMLTGVSSQKLRPEYRNDKLDKTKATAMDLPTEYLQAISAELRYCGYALTDKGS
jgi:hypothetical protein